MKLYKFYDHDVFVKLYDKENAVIMNEDGINILRAVAYSEDNLCSDIFTSQ